MPLLTKTWVLDQEIQWPQIPETTCGTSFSLPTLEESHCMALILYENNFKSFDGTAEDSDNPLWTANQYSDFFRPALNMSFIFSSILHIILLHSELRARYILTKLLVTLLYNTHFAKGVKWTAFNGLYFAHHLHSVTQLSTCLTY